jgi:acyl-CoA reductase-like NAD-dependent aldehyde dehydrogenase
VSWQNSIISPWNYPFSCTVNIILPAILAGNSVIIKPSPQTPLPAERIAATLLEAGLPQDVVQVVHTDQQTTLKTLVADSRVNYVAFTGGVVGGKAVAEAAAAGKGFKGVALELGGKDAAYVRSDADLSQTVGALVDGELFFMSINDRWDFQLPCLTPDSHVSITYGGKLIEGASVELIYVDKLIYDDFVARFVDIARKFRLGNPSSKETSLGPVISLASAARIRQQIDDAGEFTYNALCSWLQSQLALRFC